jgi:hypothetical protein
MSVASLNNGSLQLSELVISNSKYSNATGYVASSSSFSSSVTGTDLNLGLGTIDTGGITSTGPVSGTIFTTTSGGTSTFDNVNMGALTLGNAPIDIQLSCSDNNVLAIDGSCTASGPVSGTIFTTTAAGTSTFDDVNIVSALTLGTAPIDIQLSCSTNNVLAIDGSCTASGSFSAPFFGGGMYSGLYSSPTLIAANSSATVTIGSIPFNPISGWVASSIYPQFTLTSTYGDVGITGIGLVKNGDNTLTIQLDVYNPNPSNSQTLSSLYYFLFYA